MIPHGVDNVYELVGSKKRKRMVLYFPALFRQARKISTIYPVLCEYGLAGGVFATDVLTARGYTVHPIREKDKILSHIHKHDGSIILLIDLCGAGATLCGLHADVLSGRIILCHSKSFEWEVAVSLGAMMRDYELTEEECLQYASEEAAYAHFLKELVKHLSGSDYGKSNLVYGKVFAGYTCKEYETCIISGSPYREVRYNSYPELQGLPGGVVK